MKNGKGYLLIIAASFGFGVMPALALNAYSGGINVLTMLCLKYLLVSVLMVPLAALRYKAHHLPGATLGKIFLLSATLYTAQATLYAFAVTLIPVALAALILFTSPFWSVCWGRWCTRKRCPLPQSCGWARPSWDLCSCSPGLWGIFLF